MNRQLYDIIRQEIACRDAGGGSKLPASRMLAKEVGVSRNTVLYAYEQLLAGAMSRPRREVAPSCRIVFPTTVHCTTVRRKVAPRQCPQCSKIQTDSPLSRRGQHLVSTPVHPIANGVPSSPACPMSRCSRTRSGRGCSTRSGARRAGAADVCAQRWLPAAQARAGRTPAAGALGTLRARPDHPHHGYHQAIDLIGRLLADPGDKAWMEDPGYWGARCATNAGIETLPVPVVRKASRPMPPCCRTRRASSSSRPRTSTRSAW